MNQPRHTRFSEIPKFIEGSYRADVPLDQLQYQLERYRQDPGIDLDPDFQRVHVWNEAQQTAFIEHILRGGTNNILRFNSTNWQRNDRDCGPVQLVDGKQRLTAALLFLDNRIPAFGTLLRNFEDRLLYRAHLTFIINDLPDRVTVLRWYLEINEGNVAHTQEELDKVRQLLRRESTGPATT